MNDLTKNSKFDLNIDCLTKQKQSIDKVQECWMADIPLAFNYVGTKYLSYELYLSL